MVDHRLPTIVEPVDPRQARRLVRKLDWRIFPLLNVAYLLNSLDRTNLGNARLMGIEKDLGLTQSGYSWSLSIFFFGYILLMLPANLVLQRIRPSRWLGLIVMGWGTLSACMSASTGLASILTLRLLLGAAEAGFAPGVFYYLTLWYTPDEIGTRSAVFYCASIVSGAVGGLLAFGIDHLHGTGGLASWRWLFLLEGIPTVFVGVLIYLLLPDTPTTARWLTPTERGRAAQRVSGLRVTEGTGPKAVDSLLLESDNRDQPVSQSSPSKCLDVPKSTESTRAATIASTQRATVDPSSHSALVSTLRNPVVYVHSLIQLAIIIPAYATVFLLTTVIHDLGFQSWQAQLLSMPPFIVGAAFAVLLGWHSDRRRERPLHIVATSFFIGIPTFLLVAFLPSSTSAVGRYLVLLVGGAAWNSTTPLNMVWLADNFPNAGQRAVATAVTLALGSFGGVVGGQMYRVAEAPYYVPSHVGNAVSYVVVVVCCLGLRWHLERRPQQ